jgi:hypothetical protein
MFALMEFEPQQLEAKINAALQAIAARRAELKDSAESREERIALEDAVKCAQGAAAKSARRVKLVQRVLAFGLAAPVAMESATSVFRRR